MSSDIEWRKKFDAMPFGDRPCDSGCGKPPTKWFGDTSCATCGDAKCIKKQQDEYDSFQARDDE